MKTGMSTACFFCRLYNEDAVREMAALGVKDIEIFFSANMEYQKPFTDELRRICDGEGMRVRSVHSLCTQFEPQLFSEHPRQYDEAMNVFHQVVDAAAELSAGVYVFHGAMNIKRARTFRVDSEWAGEKDVYKSQARDKGTEFADVNVTLRIRFRKSKKRLVKPAAMIKIKQLVLIDNRMRVERRTKFHTGKRCSANTAGFYCKRKIADSFFRSYCRNSFRHTDAKINYAAFLQLL